MDAVRWLRANVADYGGDPEQIVLMGHSAGAHIAAMLATDPQWLGEDRSALRGLVGLAGPYDFAPFDTAAAIEAFGKWPRAEETQPITYAGSGAPPALLLTGEDDTTVKPRNSRATAPTQEHKTSRRCLNKQCKPRRRCLENTAPRSTTSPTRMPGVR